MNSVQPYSIGLVFYPGMTALDVIGPQTVFSALPNVQIYRIWKTSEPIITDDGMVIVPDMTFSDCPSLDVICIGGGLKQAAIENDPDLLDFLRKKGSTAKFVTSVCGGSVFLAKAGLLQGYRAATHWTMRQGLAELGVEVSTERVVIDGNRISGGGVTAGIDFGLTLAKILWGEDAAKLAQLLIEYNPAPPFDTGSPEQASPELVQTALSFATEHLDLGRVVS
ncbi:MAG: DJ-1/PfpI family protein [Spirulina sp. SIO3F2]|nr:DJ-1/PfpI family protein [Spirulina sp. SIO3F2]